MKNEPQKPPTLPAGLEPFDRAMRGLVKVSKAELDAEEKKYAQQKKARRARRQS